MKVEATLPLEAHVAVDHDPASVVGESVMFTLAPLFW